MINKDWAKREIEIACGRELKDSKTEFDYGCACYESAYKAYQSLMEDGHTITSIGFTKHILNRLLDRKPLTPIKDTPDVWVELPWAGKDKRSFQNKRMSSLFKEVYPDGRVEYHDNDRCCCVYRDNPDSPSWHNGFISKLIHEMYPITLPYYPESKPFVVHCTEGLHDPANGDFDTIGVWYVIKPGGEKVTIERFFKEAPKGWDEISKQEYFDRIDNRI